MNVKSSMTIVALAFPSAIMDGDRAFEIIAVLLLVVELLLLLLLLLLGI